MYIDENTEDITIPRRFKSWPHFVHTAVSHKNILLNEYVQHKISKMQCHLFSACRIHSFRRVLKLIKVWGNYTKFWDMHFWWVRWNCFILPGGYCTFTIIFHEAVCYCISDILRYLNANGIAWEFIWCCSLSCIFDCLAPCGSDLYRYLHHCLSI